jgi:hypothetical protein
MSLAIAQNQAKKTRFYVSRLNTITPKREEKERHTSSLSPTILVIAIVVCKRVLAIFRVSFRLLYIQQKI